MPSGKSGRVQMERAAIRDRGAADPVTAPNLRQLMQPWDRGTTFGDGESCSRTGRSLATPARSERWCRLQPSEFHLPTADRSRSPRIPQGMSQPRGNRAVHFDRCGERSSRGCRLSNCQPCRSAARFGSVLLADASWIETGIRPFDGRHCILFRTYRSWRSWPCALPNRAVMWGSLGQGD